MEQLLPVVHKWAAQQQRTDDVEMPPASPPASPPQSSDDECSLSEADDAAVTRSYAAAVLKPAAMQPLQHTMVPQPIKQRATAAQQQQRGAASSEAAAVQLHGLRDARAETRARMRMLADEHRALRTLQ